MNLPANPVRHHDVLQPAKLVLVSVHLETDVPYHFDPALDFQSFFMRGSHVNKAHLARLHGKGK